jgi:hypothetical protein
LKILIVVGKMVWFLSGGEPITVGRKNGVAAKLKYKETSRDPLPF